MKNNGDDMFGNNLRDELLDIADEMLPDDAHVSASAIVRNSILNQEGAAVENLLDLFYIFLVNYLEDGYRGDPFFRANEIYEQIVDELGDEAENHVADLDEIRNLLFEVEVRAVLDRMMVLADYYVPDELEPIVGVVGMYYQGDDVADIAFHGSF